MAIVKLGELVVGIRGTVGGVMFSANRQGNYCRVWSRGPAQMTEKQGVQRGYLGSHGNYWRALTQDQRDDWDTFAALPGQELENSLGEPYYICGFAWFCSYNNNNLRMGRARISDAPVVAVPGAPGLLKFEVHTDEALIQYATDHFVGFGCVVMIARARTSGVQVMSSGYRWIASIDSPGEDTQEFWTEFVEVFGMAQVGEKWFLWCAKQNSEGRMGAYRAKNYVTAD